MDQPGSSVDPLGEVFVLGLDFAERHRGGVAPASAVRISAAEGQARREATRALSEAIDRALLQSSADDRRSALDLLQRRDATRLADRVRLQAARLARARTSQCKRILAAADALVLSLYHQAAPAGWLCGWCDAAVVRAGPRRAAGVGVIVFDESGREIDRICMPIAGREPFEAEIAALEATIEAVARQGRAKCMCVYTDCAALVSLWLRQRSDPRLSAVRTLTGRLRRFELRVLPRRHNQCAHRLAREAALGAPAQRTRER